ncbi:MAG: transglutaminase-like domain-containing protein [Trichlorobacter sp.]|uniref:transglutaminase-like domain-containing protein n=1 Tax=Trichlorobacter sp. TaxID=2911007 RepID=UPI00256ACEEE|nr:transglutaminase-like domain-containing protein [Trichlorobacter sp.]MDK9717312.1 transglutaminase-like domain-containing protein [Trichlorobacter sp.]
MRKSLLTTCIVICSVFMISLAASAKTLVLEGNLDGAIAMRQSMEFSVNKGTVSSFSFKFALPATFTTRTVSQRVDGLDIALSPQPTSSTVETDRFGNKFQRVSWNDVSQDIRVNLSYTANVHTQLTDMASKTAFPLGNLASKESLYLQHTDMVQGDSAIKSLARQLTSGAQNEYEAVSAIINWVTDNIEYTFNPPQYDASYTLSTKSGNCQNFAHLSIALLRSSGIPARIVGGITLKEAWKVPIDAKNSIVQSMGQGGHAWLEVYFPDLGWLPYDPQQSRQFTSSRHIKQTHGLDSRDINDTWKGGPYLPAYNELIEGRYTSDNIKLKMKRYASAPRPYILSNAVTAGGAVSETPDTGRVIPPPAKHPRTESKTDVASARPTPPPQGSGAGPAETRFISDDDSSDEDQPKPVKPVKPKQPTKVGPKTPKIIVSKPPVIVEPAHKKPRPGTVLAFGNMDFPALVNLYNVKGDTGTRVFERETSEYVTSKHIFAQAIQVKDRMSLEKISLAMRKFGGDGSVYIDLVKDKGGKPDIMQGTRSNLLDLEKIPRKPGYYWVDFSFPPDGNKPQQLAPGKYWIVFRASGEAIMNWLFTPGKPYGEGDDTRSTAKGFQWEDILNYDFVFKVNGKAI